MSLDLVRQPLVLFGGFQQGPPPLADTWEFDGETWAQRSTVGSPPGSWGHALAYDVVRRRTVLFGAFTGTWEWDGTTWTPPTLGVAPASRFYPAMVLDLSRGKIVMYGGIQANAAGTPLGDTWTYDGSWVQLASNPAMPRRGRHAMAYEPNRRRVVVHGGHDTA